MAKHRRHPSDENQSETTMTETETENFAETSAETSADGTADQSVPSQQITIQGIIFSAPAPYAEGHVLSVVEANVLNQTYGENLRNNFAAVIRKKLEEMNKAAKAAAEAAGLEFTELKSYPAELMDDLRAEFAAYSTGYAFATRTARAPSDPVRAEALKIASELVKAALRSRNLKQKDMVEGQFDKLVDDLVAKRPEIMEEARNRVKATAALAEAGLAGLGL